MLKKNLESVAGCDGGRRSRRFSTAPLRSLWSALALGVLLPAALAGQGAGQYPSPTGVGTPQATVYGSGYQVPLEYEGEHAPANAVSLSVGASTLYDDNVLGSNSERLSDEALSFDARLGIQRRTKRATLTFTYSPFFILYRRVTTYDRTNHAGNLSFSYRLSSRFILGLQDNVYYENGIYPVLTEQQIFSGPPSPIGPNGIIVPYSVRTLSDMSGLYLTFMKSRRTSVTLTGGYNRSKYGQKGQFSDLPLYNGSGFSGGLTLEHYITPHTNVGVLILHQDTTYQGGFILGERQRTQIESAYLSLASTLAPTVTISLFGGPQYVRSIGLSSPSATLSAHLQSSGGGSITKQVRKTALNLAVIRSVTDGGGLYTSTLNTRVLVGARRRLGGSWEASLHVGAAREDTSLFRAVGGRIDGVIGGVLITRPILTQGFVLHISYDTMHQLSTGPLPLVANFDRNQVALGFDYQIKSLSLGR